MRGLRPSPVKVEESVSGALLGLVGVLGTDTVGFGSTFGLEVNSEDIIWAGWRGFGFCCTTDSDAAEGRWESFRRRLGGRSSAILTVVWEKFWARALRFSILFDLSLRVVCTVRHSAGIPKHTCQSIDHPSSRVPSWLMVLPRVRDSKPKHHSWNWITVIFPQKVVDGSDLILSSAQATCR